MPVPVVNTTTSILGYKQHEPWSYQPWASDLTGDDGWTSSPLPTGMSLNSGTGLISGAATVAGVFIVGLQVTNSNGTSLPISLTIGIEPASGSLNSGADVSINLSTGAVTVNTAAAEGPLLTVKEDDDLLLYVQFRRGETVVDLGTLASLYFGLKELDTDALVTLGGGTGAETPKRLLKTGSGTTTTYICAVKFDGTMVEAALSNHEADEGTSFVGRAELQWVETNALLVGPATLKRTSQTFEVEVVRDMVA
ncbi:MAG: putative Ig domain [Chthoniobacter sp.]|jgi:hypothetical protein|nr:putative Ig domain [Chthoniobacter sp.]